MFKIIDQPIKPKKKNINRKSQTKRKKPKETTKSVFGITVAVVVVV
jgi:hypothetical protein